MARPFERGLLGGTFDHFHQGHEKLILTALKECDALEIWITSDKIASQKTGAVQSFSERSSFLKSWIGKKQNEIGFRNGDSPRVFINELEDNVGPAEWRNDCDAIICTEETLPACEQINSTRLESNLEPLNIISVEHFLTKDGSILSSSLIRNGTYTREGEKWIDDSKISNILQMPKSIEGTLKKPFGTLFEGPEEDTSIAISKLKKDFDFDQISGKVVAVGDVCVSALRQSGIIPDISVIDGRTKRQDLPEELIPKIQGYDEIINCKNPAGKITPEFSNCLISAAKSNHKVMIKVEGEEDLAPIILHLALPLDAYVIYGQPNEGIVICISDEKVKLRCKSRIETFIPN
tara:strand:+ start:60 stop:1106 length:1047 start_codon:yes stop_codon:yes gene_type:complete